MQSTEKQDESGVDGVCHLLSLPQHPPSFSGIRIIISPFAKLITEKCC